MILPEMNDFISKIGGADKKGYTIAFFTISALISRPFSGKLSDLIGRKKVAIIGFVIALFASLLYPICTNLYFFLAIRFLHGFSAGFSPTGATALITDSVPEEKRGVAMGIFGVFISLGIGTGQGISTLISDSFGVNSLFFISAILVLVSTFLMRFVTETLENLVPFKLELLNVKKNELLERNVFPVAIVMTLSAFCSGIIFVLSPEMSKIFGISNKGAFFVYYVLMTIVTRLIFGRISDKIGRPQTLLMGMILLSISMLTLASATSENQFTIGSIVFGLATGISSPSLFAWTADLSPPHRRGIGAGTMFIALEIGIMLGSFSVDFTFDGTIKTLFNALFIGVLTSATAVIYLSIFIVRKRARKLDISSTKK